MQKISAYEKGDYRVSEFCKRLEPVGRILEEEGWYVWCCSPIQGQDGKIHVFISRWPVESQQEGWLTHCEVAHAVAQRPEGPYRILGTALKGRSGKYWDAATIHNPTIHKVGDRYALFYMGNSDGTVDTQRIGLAISGSLDGPWERVGDSPVIDVSPDKKDWDNYITTNPAFLRHPNGQYWLYYKSWDRYNDNFRKLGLAIADKLEGPYRKYPGNPIVDFSGIGKQVEDAYVFIEDGKFHMIMRDMGVIHNRVGLYLDSDDGIHWSEHMLGYKMSSEYFNEKTERFERPQILMHDGKPAYMFLGLMGSRHGTYSPAVLRINDKGKFKDKL